MRLFLDFTSVFAENKLFIAQEAKNPVPTLRTMPLLLLPLSGDRHAPKKTLLGYRCFKPTSFALVLPSTTPITRQPSAFHAIISQSTSSLSRGCYMICVASFAWTSSLSFLAMNVNEMRCQRPLGWETSCLANLCRLHIDVACVCVY